MKKIILGIGAVAILSTANAQRYKDQTFSVGVPTTVTGYSVANTAAGTSAQDLDVYTPTGDAETNRPVIVFAHGGNFIGGTKADGDVVYLAKEFAKRGYVTVSINYSLTSALNLLDSNDAYEPVLMAVSDGKAAVRYLRENASTYGIDPNKVYFIGESAGAILGLNYAFLDTLPKATPLLASIINQYPDGLEGVGGHFGTSSKLNAIVGLAGGLLSKNWIDGYTNIPTLLLHGDADATVPYGHGPVLGGASNIQLYGSGELRPMLCAAGLDNQLHVWEGGEHVPWANGTYPNPDMTAADSIIRDFLYPYASSTGSAESDCASGVSTIENGNLLSVYPNPAHNVINISAENNAEIKNVRLFSVLGQTAYNGTETKINTQSLQSGIYFVEVTFKNNLRAVKRVEVLK